MRLADILAGLIAQEQQISPEEAQAQAKREIIDLMAEIDQRLDQRADLEEYGQLVHEADALEHLYTV